MKDRMTAIRLYDLAKKLPRGVVLEIIEDTFRPLLAGTAFQVDKATALAIQGRILPKGKQIRIALHTGIEVLDRDTFKVPSAIGDHSATYRIRR